MVLKILASAHLLIIVRGVSNQARESFTSCDPDVSQYVQRVACASNNRRNLLMCTRASAHSERGL